MKIAHVLTRFSPERNPGGVERVVEELAKRQAEDHEVEVVCRNEFDDPGEEDYEGFIVKRAGVADRSGLRTLSSLQSMRKLIRDSEADIYHIHDWSPYLNYYFSSEPGKSVLTLHNRAFNFFTRRLQDSCISRADRVTAVSGSIESRLDIDVKVVPDGVDTGSFVPLESGDYYLYAGNLIENKGIRELVSVWREEWPLMKVAGSGPLRDKLEDKENIEYLGEIPHQNMPELIGRSKGVILPSRSEGFGLVWAEALSCGKPVLATDTGLGTEIPDYCGVRIDTDYTERELESGIEELKDGAYDTDDIRSYAERNFDWGEVMKQYIEIYR